MELLEKLYNEHGMPDDLQMGSRTSSAIKRISLNCQKRVLKKPWMRNSWLNLEKLWKCAMKLRNGSISIDIKTA